MGIEFLSEAAATEVSWAKACHAAGADWRIKFRKKQLIARIFGFQNENDVRMSLFRVVEHILRMFRLDSELQFPEQFRKFVQDDSWIEAPVKTLNELWKVTNDQRKEALSDAREAGLIEWTKRYVRNDNGELRARSRFRLNPYFVCKLLAEICDPLTREVPIGEVQEAASINHGKAQENHEQKSDSLWRNIPPSILIIEPLAVTPVACDAAASGFSESQKTQTHGSGNQNVVTESTDVAVLIEVAEVIETLQSVFPVKTWKQHHVRKIERLFRRSDRTRLTRERVHLWIHFRDGSSLLPDVSQLSDWYLCENDLDAFIERWPRIWCFIQKSRHSIDAADAECGFAAIKNLNGALLNALAVTYNRIQTIMRERCSDFEAVLKSRWSPLEGPMEDQALIGRFMLMQKSGHWWNDMIAEFSPQLSRILRDDPLLYYALEEAGYHVDRWVPMYHRPAISNAAYKALYELHRSAAVSEYWYAH